MGLRRDLERDLQVLADGIVEADKSGDTKTVAELSTAFNRLDGRLQLVKSDPAEFDPDSPEFRERFGPTSGMSGFQRFRAGFGKAFADIGRGAAQRATEIGGVFSEDLERQARERERQTALARERDEALLGTGAGFAGNLAGNIAAFAPVSAVAAPSVGGAAALGAVEGFLQPTVSEGEIRLNTFLGGGLGAAGQGVARGLQRAFRPINPATAELDNAVRLLRNEGIDLDVSQRSGSRVAEMTRSFLGDNPITAGRQEDFVNRQLKQFTRSVLKTIGVKNQDSVTEDVLNGAVDRIGREIDDAAVVNRAFFSTDTAAELQAIQRTLPRRLLRDQQAAINSNIDDLLQSIDADSLIDGNKFVEIRGNLSALSKQSGMHDVARAVEDLMLKALDDGGGSRAALKTALAHWRNFRIIENSIDLGVDRTISPRRLSTTLNQLKNRALSLRSLGHKDSKKLAKLARAGRSVLPEPQPQSGTLPRLLAAELALGAGGAGAGLATGQDLTTSIGIGATTAAGGLALPMLLQRGLLSQGALGNFLVGGGPAALRRGTASPLTQSLLRQGVISGGLLSQ